MGIIQAYYDILFFDVYPVWIVPIIDKSMCTLHTLCLMYVLRYTKQVCGSFIMQYVSKFICL